jgi:hypothetical protein
VNKNNSNISWIINKRFIGILLTGFAVTVILTYVITLRVFIKPFYESEAIGFAPGMFQKDEQEGSTPVGQSDAYIQILRSSVMADSLNRLFNLMRRFGLHSGQEQEKSRMLHELNNRMKVERNRYGAVSVKFLDHDPDMAAEMANSVLVLGDKIWQNIFSNSNLPRNNTPGSRMVSYAIPGHQPVKPNRLLLMVLAGGLAVFVLVALRIIQFGTPHEEKNR